MSARLEILEYLKAGHSITRKECAFLFNDYTLSSRISELRKQGWPILSEKLELDKFSTYKLDMNTVLWPEV